MTVEEITRRVRDARALLNELQKAELRGVNSAELCANAGRLQFELCLLERELEVVS